MVVAEAEITIQHNQKDEYSITICIWASESKAVAVAKSKRGN